MREVNNRLNSLERAVLRHSIAIIVLSFSIIAVNISLIITSRSITRLVAIAEQNIKEAHDANRQADRL